MLPPQPAAPPAAPPTAPLASPPRRPPWLVISLAGALVLVLVVSVLVTQLNRDDGQADTPRTAPPATQGRPEADTASGIVLTILEAEVSNDAAGPVLTVLVEVDNRTDETIRTDLLAIAEGCLADEYIRHEYPNMGH